jgi:hypothetical protein
LTASIFAPAESVRHSGWKIDLAAADARQAEILHPDHMAHLGGQLFSRYLIAVEVAGTLLLVALVGAVAIVMHGGLKPDARKPGGPGSMLREAHHG